MNQRGTADVDMVMAAADVIEDLTVDETTVAANTPVVDIVIHHE